MKPLTIILLLLIIIIVYYVYSNDIETFIPSSNKTSLFNTFDSYQQLRPLYHPHIKRGYNTCSCGAKKGNKIDIFMASKKDAYSWGKQKIDIYILN